MCGTADVAGRPLPERERWRRRSEETTRRVRDIVGTERFASMVTDIQNQFLKDLRAFITGAAHTSPHLALPCLAPSDS